MYQDFPQSSSKRTHQHAHLTFIRDITTKTFEFTSLTISHSLEYIIAGCSDGVIRFFNLLTSSSDINLSYHSGLISCIDISHDDHFIVSGDVQFMIYVYNLYTQSIIHRFEHYLTVHSLAISSDNKFIISGSGDTTCRIWNLQDGSYQVMFESHSYRKVKKVSISLDCKTVAFTYMNKVIVYNFDKEATIKMFENHTKNTTCLAISNNNRYIASGSKDNTIRIWLNHNFNHDYRKPDYRSNQDTVLKGHKATIKSLGFSTYNTHLVSCSKDKSILVWNLMTNRIIHHIYLNASIKSISISRGDKYLIGLTKKKIYTWRFLV
jgi:WD40 repeat protein